jgi:hypothetical protein
MEIELICETTEYAVYPDKKNEKISFYIHENCLVISFCDKDENVLTQSEISIEDARKLAQVLNLNFI